MSINRYAYPYEILFRLTETGGLQGCHRRDLEVVRDDETGTVYSTKETDPQPVAGSDMDEVLGSINVALVTNLAEAEASVDRLSADLAQLQHQHGLLQNSYDQALRTGQNAIAERDAQIQQLTQILQSQQQRIDDSQAAATPDADSEFVTTPDPGPETTE